MDQTESSEININILMKKRIHQDKNLSQDGDISDLILYKTWSKPSIKKYIYWSLPEDAKPKTGNLSRWKICNK